MTMSQWGYRVALATALLACVAIGIIGLVPPTVWPRAPQLMTDLWASHIAPFFIIAAGLLGVEHLLSTTRR
jgi:hypothetical protein